MFRNPRHVFLLLIVLAIGLIFIDLPENYRLNFRIGSLTIDRVVRPPVFDISLFGFRWHKEIKTHVGLDLAGGTQLTLEANMNDIEPQDRASALESAREVIDRRVNFFGVAEPIVQSAISPKSYRIYVELPGITDATQAAQAVGQTARLEFREFLDEEAATGAAAVYPLLTNTASVGITGKDLRRSNVEFSTQTGQTVVAIEFTPDGSRKFADVTTRLVGKKLAIFLDDLPVTWPNVQEPITDGRGVISGNFTRESAKLLALQLNAGALPVPVSIIQEKTIGATLGLESVTRSIQAGAIGLVIVAAFMIAQYGRLGVLADLALILYGLISFAIIRWIPVTLTLPGIAGLILSIGMAVDSNILIFERFKDELRSGKPWRVAMELGFGRAWDSIRDANFTTIISCFILFNPGNWAFLPTSGMVRGFAATLFIGVVVSLFTGIVVTRTFVRVLYKKKGL